MLNGRLLNCKKLQQLKRIKNILTQQQQQQQQQQYGIHKRYLLTTANNVSIQSQSQSQLQTSLLYKHRNINTTNTITPSIIKLRCLHNTSTTKVDVKKKEKEKEKGGGGGGGVEQDPKNALKRIIKLALPERNLILASMATLGITSSISLIFPAVIGKTLDLSVMTSEEIAALQPELMLGGLMGLFALQGVCIVGRTAMLNVAGERVVARFRKNLFTSLLAKDMEFFDKIKTGEMINRLSADTQLVQKAVTNNLVQGLRNSTIAVGGTFMLIYTSPSLAMLSLSVIPPVFILGRRYGRYVKERQKQVQDNLAATSTVAEEVLSNIRTVRQFSAENYENAKYNKKIDQSYLKACQVGLASAWFDGSVHFSANMSLVAVIAYGGYQVMEHHMTAGTLTSFMMYSLYVGFNASSLSSVYSELMKGVGASQRIFNIIDTMPTVTCSINSPNAKQQQQQIQQSTIKYIDGDHLSTNNDNNDDDKMPLGANLFGLANPENKIQSPYGTSLEDQDVSQAGYAMLGKQVAGKLQSPPLKGSVTLKQVSFHYPTRPDAPILNNLDLQVDHGTSLALVGGSGSGKSTVGALITRLYDPIEGEIFIDNIPLTQIDPHWLRLNIGVVSQEPVLFSGTIRDNICYGKHDATEEEINQAAQVASALDFIRSFPDGMDTLVGERGMQLSGGQKQRIALARAILKQPKVLILDEATSALDSESEFLVQQAIENISSGSGESSPTVISIAHRLSTMRSADKIAVLQDGAIVEYGTYDELLKNKDGFFHQLVQRQLDSY